MKKTSLIFLAVIVALFATFAAASWSAARTKGPTYDETLHAPASILHLRVGDYRVSAEHPPLWKYWAALPSLLAPLPNLNLDAPAFAIATRDNVEPWTWAKRTMYATPGNDPDRLLFQARAMMLALAVGVGATTAAWAWRLGGPVAATIAAALFALDPNLIAHAPLITNDVATAGTIVLCAIATWRAGRRLTLGRAIALGLACGVALATKFTGVLVVPIVATLLAGRALAPDAWVVGRRALKTRGPRVLAAIATLAVVGVVAYFTLWATYRFRYAATPTGEPRFELRRLADEAMIERAKLRDHVVLGPDQVSLDVPCRVVLALADHRLVPEAYLGGFLHAYAQSIYRATYVLGEPGAGGVWWYFPFALWVKEPIATLSVAVLAAIVTVRRSMFGVRIFPNPWTIACLLVPPAIVLLAAMRVNLNIGVRHVFAIYPFAFIAIGIMLAPTLTTRRRTVVAAVLALALAAESFAAWPDFLSFFNLAAGGQRGGLKLLGDSNLDWGQDVPALVAWQRAHPARTLTLAYFGTDDPRARGLRYQSLIDDGSGIPPVDVLPTSGVVAISATMLQIRWDDLVAAQFFGAAKELPPTEVLGGSIYLYDLGGK